LFIADESLQRNEQENADESVGGGLSGTEDASILIQQIRRETTGIAKSFILKRHRCRYGDNTKSQVGGKGAGMDTGINDDTGTGTVSGSTISNSASASRNFSSRNLNYGNTRAIALVNVPVPV
jgi:hypothetical protein